MKGKTTTFMLETSQDLCWGWVGGEESYAALSSAKKPKKKRGLRCEDQKLPWGLFFCPSPTPWWNKESSAGRATTPDKTLEPDISMDFLTRAMNLRSKEQSLPPSFTYPLFNVVWANI